LPYDYDASQSHLSADPPAGAGFSAYPSGSERRSGDGGFRPATPNSKGQYSNAVLDELESQNDDQVSEMTKKVRMLKDVSRLSLEDIGSMILGLTG
jgi:blocked-early-in-transport protein 1